MRKEIPAHTVVTCDRCQKDLSLFDGYPKNASVALKGHDEWSEWGTTKDLCPTCALHVARAVYAAMKP